MAFCLLAVIYLLFVSLGLPDSLLGSGWPTMQTYFGVPSSYVGYVAMTISFMTIISSLLSPYLIRKLHTKWIALLSLILTVVGLLGFSVAGSYNQLLFFAIPYGLGAGAIDAATNHYVSLHYSGAVMNYLHCFYGLGAIISPNIMAVALKVSGWKEGYLWTAFIQTGILMICIFSLPLWEQNKAPADKTVRKSAGLKETVRVPGVILTLIAFFAYCSGEGTCFIWTSSYFAGTKTGLSDSTIAAFGSLIFAGLMFGRIISGLTSKKISTQNCIRIGIAVELFGIGLVMAPVKTWVLAAIGIFIIGTGMGPVYPGIQHMAPKNFGQRYSAAVIGLQMASAYIGATFMPTIFGIIQQHMGIDIFPVYILIFAILNVGFLELSYKVRKVG